MKIEIKNIKLVNTKIIEVEAIDNSKLCLVLGCEVFYPTKIYIFYQLPRNYCISSLSSKNTQIALYAIPIVSSQDNRCHCSMDV